MEFKLLHLLCFSMIFLTIILKIIAVVLFQYIMSAMAAFHIACVGTSDASMTTCDGILRLKNAYFLVNIVSE